MNLEKLKRHIYNLEWRKYKFRCEKKNVCIQEEEMVENEVSMQHAPSAHRKHAVATCQHTMTQEGKSQELIRPKPN